MHFQFDRSHHVEWGGRNEKLNNLLLACASWTLLWTLWHFIEEFIFPFRGVRIEFDVEWLRHNSASWKELQFERTVNAIPKHSLERLKHVRNFWEISLQFIDCETIFRPNQSTVDVVRKRKVCKIISRAKTRRRSSAMIGSVMQQKQIRYTRVAKWQRGEKRFRVAKRDDDNAVTKCFE